MLGGITVLWLPAGSDLDRSREPGADRLLPDDRDRPRHVAWMEARVRAARTCARRRDAAAGARGDDGARLCADLVGATMRHTDAGLAIPDFPLAFGHLIPPQLGSEDRRPLRASRRRAGGHHASYWPRLATSSTTTDRARSAGAPSALLLLVLVTAADHARRADRAEPTSTTSSTRCTWSPARPCWPRRWCLTLRTHRGSFDEARRIAASTTSPTDASRMRAPFEATREDRARRRRRARRSSPSPAGAVSRDRGRALDFVALTKPRLNLLVLLTTLAGLYLAAPDGVAVGARGAHADRHGARGRRRRSAQPGVGARHRSR